jgi:hypothetical protein
VKREGEFWDVGPDKETGMLGTNEGDFITRRHTIGNV